MTKQAQMSTCPTLICHPVEDYEAHALAPLKYLGVSMSSYPAVRLPQPWTYRRLALRISHLGDSRCRWQLQRRRSILGEYLSYDDA
jgi:hypothetical protein